MIKMISSQGSVAGNAEQVWAGGLEVMLGWLWWHREPRELQEGDAAPSPRLPPSELREKSGKNVGKSIGKSRAAAGEGLQGEREAGWRRWGASFQPALASQQAGESG